MKLFVLIPYDDGDDDDCPWHDPSCLFRDYGDVLTSLDDVLGAATDAARRFIRDHLEPGTAPEDFGVSEWTELIRIEATDDHVLSVLDVNWFVRQKEIPSRSRHPSRE